MSSQVIYLFIQLTESDKFLKAFEEQNTSIDSYIIMTNEGVPFKYNPNNITHQDAVKICGLIFELAYFSKKTFDDFKRTPNYGNITLRMRLKTGLEIIVVQGIIHIF